MTLTKLTALAADPRVSREEFSNAVRALESAIGEGIYLPGEGGGALRAALAAIHNAGRV